MLLRSWFLIINILTNFNQGWPQFTIFPEMATLSKFKFLKGWLRIPI